MGKRANLNTPTLPLDTYRKQLGKQEDKVVKTRVKEVKQKKSEQKQVDKFKTFLIALAVFLILLFGAYILVSILNRSSTA